MFWRGEPMPPGITQKTTTTSPLATVGRNPQIQTGAKREQPSRIRTVVDLGHVVDRGWPNVLAAFDP
jgi:hypothetical protein